MSSTVYLNQDSILLYFERIVGAARLTGLTVTVTVVNNVTRATILAATACTELISGNGFYQYNWTHNQASGTQCEAIYTVNGNIYTENFTINYDSGGSAR